MTELFEVGVITAPRGLKGEVKVYPLTDDPQRFREMKRLLLEDGSELSVREVRFFKGLPLIVFEGITSPEEAEKLRGKKLFVRREDAVPLKDGEFFIADLIGNAVVTEEGEPVGSLKDVLKTGANDVFVIACADGSEKLIPVVDDFVREINAKEERITVRLLPEI